MTNLRFLADESVGSKLANLLKKSGYDTIFAGYAMPEVDDTKVLSFAKHENRVLITADKDFGELIFKRQIPSSGIILLRTLTRDPEKRFEMIKAALDKAKDKFVVVKEGQIRVRGLK